MLLLSSIWCCLDFAHFGPPISPATWIPYGFQIPSTQWYPVARTPTRNYELPL